MRNTNPLLISENKEHNTIRSGPVLSPLCSYTSFPKCFRCSNLPTKNEYLRQCKVPSPYICPTCMLSAFDPWKKHIDCIVKPQYLLDSSAKPTIINFNYCLTPIEDYLIIRCLQISSTKYEMKWPIEAEIILNSKMLLSFSTNTTTTINSYTNDKPVQKNKGLAVFPLKGFTSNGKKNTIFDFKQFFQLNTSNNSTNNKLIITHSKTDTSLYVISIDTIKTQKEVQDVIKEAKTLYNINTIKTLVGINSEIQIQSEKIDLIDVYTGINRVKLPARGLNCIHLGVFDLRNFLLFTKRSKKSICPICNKHTGEVYIDGVILDKIRKIDKLIGLYTNNEYQFTKEEIEDEINKDKDGNDMKDKPVIETIYIDDDSGDDKDRDKDKENEEKMSNSTNTPTRIVEKDESNNDKGKYLNRKRERGDSDANSE